MGERKNCEKQWPCMAIAVVVKTSLTLKSKSIIKRASICSIHSDFGGAKQNYHTEKIKKKLSKNIN